MGALKRHPVLFLGLSLTVLFLIFGYIRVGFLETLDLKFYDMMMGARTEPDADSQIVLVDIDESSIVTLGRWPWSRSVLADGVDKISQGDPKVIGLSIILAEPERNQGLVELGNIQKAFDDFGMAQTTGGEQFAEALKQARQRLDNDARLADSIKAAGNVVLPFYYETAAVMGDSGDAQLIERLEKDSLPINAVEENSSWPVAAELVLPIPGLMDAARGIGHINLDYSRVDNTVRKEMPFVEFDGLYLPSYTLELAAASLNLPRNKISLDPGWQVVLGNLDIPVNSYSELLISFKGGFESFQNFSFVDVVNEKIPASVFRNKVVMVSLSAPGLATLVPTPEGNLPQGEFHANVIWAMLNKRFIHVFDWGLLHLALTLLVGALITFVLPRLKAGLASGVFAAVLILLAVTSIWAFSGGLWVRTTYAMLQLILGYIGVVSIRYLMTQKGEEKALSESAEVNRMLGVSFQNQGMLDMAFDKFRKVPVDEEMKSLLYNLSLDFERKRQLNKAAAVYEYIEEHDPKYKDVAQRKTRLMQASETMVFGPGMFGSSGGDNLLSGNMDTAPTLGRYEVKKMLGQGAMGVVYLGQDPRINRTTAIKTVRFTDDFEAEEAEEMKKKFFREAESAGTLAHPNIVTIYDAGEEQDLAYIAMEYLEGSDLEDYIKPDKLLPMRKVIGYIADIADGLGYAHDKGIVHRDIKPANIMLIKSGVVKITDFGIARIQASSQTATGVVKGTPYYMSPEQIAGEKVDGRSDIFSLGVMLYQMTTGVLPFKGDSIAALMHQVMNIKHADPREHNPKIYKPLAGIIDRALEKDKDKRYQKAEQMAAHLRALAKKIDVAAAQKKAQASK